MKSLSILTALVVGIALYALVFERDRLLSFAGRDAAPAAEATEAAPRETPQAAAQAAAKDPENLVSVVVLNSTAQVVDNAIVLRGQTEAARQVDVRAETGGLVISPPLRKGAFVDAGTTLCQIDPGTRPAQLAEAQARLAEASISNTAASKLAEGGFASETRAVGAKATLQAAQAAVEAAETEIGRLTLAAPFAGLLESDAAELGSLMQAGSLCATVIQLDPIKIVAYLPETAIDAIRPGATAEAALSSGRAVTGQVSYIARSADPATRTFRVEISADNADLSIRDGVTANIAIAADGVKAHLIPASALTLNDNGAMGLRTVDDDNRVAFFPVRIVRDTPQGVVVTGLPEQVRVITVGQEFVTDGVAVRVGRAEGGT
ncbi:MAG: efflux RND transporter periplasmic adaptor subunit [Rhodobacteraceae bacterium]|nr:efflux RND transporter periplasmic adaptor subunit [Paracoccaceae bacterium]